MADEADKAKNAANEIGKAYGDARLKALELEKSMANYLKTIKDIGEIERNLVKQKELQVKTSKKLSDAAADLKRIKKLGSAATQKELETAEALVAEHESVLSISKDFVVTLNNNNKKLKEAVKHVDKQRLAWSGIKKGAQEAYKAINRGYGKLKGSGVFEMDKEFRDAGRSMNISNKSFEKFRNVATDAAKTTNKWGVSTKELVKAQASYSNEIGRSVALTDEGYKGLALMGQATGIGVDGAASMAAEMDKFGVSVIGATDIIGDTVDMAHTMGLNATKVTKTLQSNLKLAQRYHFKGGVKGLVKMVGAATRLKLDLDGIAGMADKVFRPEGAVEMAAKLQTMGGEFAKLADPFQLMFKARNDFEGFAKDIGKATKEFVQFNMKTGEALPISGGMLDKMREISQITGLSVEKLQEMGVQAKKMEQFGGLIPSVIRDPEDRELIASLMSKGKDGVFRVKLGAEEFDVSKLRSTFADNYRKEKGNLETRAEQALTFDETLKGFMDTFKSELLPIAQKLKDNLGVPLKNMMDTFKSEGFYEGLRDFAKSAGEFITGVIAPLIKVSTQFMSWAGPKGTLATILGVGVVMNATKWYANGKALAIGFNTLASGGGAASAAASYGTTGGKIGPAMSSKTPPKSMGSKMMKGTGKMMKGLGRVAAPIAIASAGLDLIGNLANDKLSKGEGLLKTLDENKMAALGATIGSFLGPGGTMAGAGLGGMLDSVVPTIGNYDDYIVQGGKINSISSDDVNIGVKDGGVVDKMLGNNSNSGGDSIGGVMKHTHSPIRIEGTIKLEGNGGNVGSIDLENNPMLIREITNMVNQGFAKASNQKANSRG